MPSVSLIGYKIKKVDMVNEIKSQGELKVGNTFEYSVAYAEDNSRAIATLTEIINMVDHPEQFHMNVAIEGIFELSDVVDNDTKKDAHVMCYDELFPFANNIVTQLAQNSGMGGLVLRKLPMDKDKIQFGSKTQDKVITLPTK
jgi:preprotein translocase subunit SecB